MIKKYLRIGDVIVAFAVIASALVLSMFMQKNSSDGEAFYIKTESGEYVYPLDEDMVTKFESNGVSLTVEARDGKVGVVASECADGLCEKRGFISKSGETVVCLPSKVVIGIVPKKESGDADAVVG